MKKNRLCPKKQKKFEDYGVFMEKEIRERKLIAVFTNNDDDVYCFRKELIESLVDAGYDVLVSCPYGEKLDLMNGIKYIYDNPVIDRRGTNIVADGKLFLHYVNVLKKYRPDVVLTYTAKPNVYCGFAAYLCKIPVISNVTGFGSVLRNSPLVQKLIMTLFKMSFRKSACVMFQNAANMNLAKEKGMLKGDYLLIAGSGVNVDRYPLLPYPDGNDGKTGETVVFNYIGRILHDKGVDDYIEAASRIRKKYPNTRFNMLGFIEPTERYYEEKLKKLGEEDIVHYLGSQKDVKPFIERSHATIHPSTYGEGMSNVLLESASSGRPIISTDNPGCKETFKDGETGFMYHGGNVDELTEKIEKFLALSNDERRKMGEKGREYVKENFSRDLVVKAYLGKIKEIIS